MTQTPEQEKARELISEFFDHTHDEKKSKECALFMVDEIMKLDVWDWPHNAEHGILFWEKVKEEINKL